jgi:hypothetical protein
VHLERYDEADPVVVDRGEDGVAGGEDEAVEVVQDGGLDGLAGSGGDRHTADRGHVAGPRAHAHLERSHPGGRASSGGGTHRALPLEFPLLFAAESRHRFPHSG